MISVPRPWADHLLAPFSEIGHFLSLRRLCWKIWRLMQFQRVAILIGSSLTLKTWIPITTRWEMIVLPTEIRFYPYSPDKTVWHDLTEITRYVEEELGPFELEPEVHYIDFENAQALL